MKFECTHCQQRIETADDLGGQAVECPTCGQPTVVPSPVRMPAQRAVAPQGGPVPRRQQGGGSGGGKTVLFVVLLAAALAAVFYFRNSQPELWDRWTRYIENLIHPAPTPAPAPAATPTPAPTPTPPPPPTPTPTPAPTAAPAPSAPDPLAWLAEHKALQPREVKLLEPEDFPVVFNGHVMGSATVPAGSVLKVISIGSDGVMAAYGEGTSLVSIKSTDLLQQAVAEMANPPPPRASPSPAQAAAVTQATATPSPANGAAALDEWAASLDGQKTTIGAAPGAFIHPGLLVTDADFRRIKSHLGREPWKAGWEILITNPHASLAWRPNPVPVVVRGTGARPENYGRLYNDIAAAYACALRWRISDDVAYANKAVEIMNAWSPTLKEVTGTSDKFLAAGIYGYEFANAAEIMRTYPGWKPDDFARFQKMMIDVFYPMNHDFLERHNGAAVDHYWGNWDECNMASVMAIGVLCDKREIYEEAVDYFKYGKGNGAIHQAVNFIYSGNLGQMQESGRDQGHCTLNISLLEAVCQIAWSQGDDLYGYDNNRFLAGCEYVAKYNLGYDVPFHPYVNSSFKTDIISPAGRGTIRPCWEMVYNHYAICKGLPAPYCKIFAEKVRPEGGGGDYGPNSGGYDQLGYGTLTFTLDPAEQSGASSPPP